MSVTPPESYAECVEMLSQVIAHTQMPTEYAAANKTGYQTVLRQIKVGTLPVMRVGREVLIWTGHIDDLRRYSPPRRRSTKTNKSTSRGTRLPEDFLPMATTVAIIRGEHPWLTEDDLKRGTLGFRDYWKSVPGVKGTKMDWDATWRNWMRREFRGRTPSGRRSKVEESFYDSIEMGRQLANKMRQEGIEA